MSDLFWMQKAYEAARLAREAGEVPVGAVLVGKDNTLLSCAGNEVEQTQDPCAHAEILAIQKATKVVHNHRLLGSTLYVTLEPCVMCAGALVHARIKRLVFATRDFKAGAAGSVLNVLQGHPMNHQVVIDEGLLQKECAQLLSDFFKTLRKC